MAMKKTLIILVLCTLAVGAVAQTKKVVKTKTVNTQYITQPSIMFFGIGGGEYVYSGTREFTDNNGNTSEGPYEYQSGILGVQGGYLYSLFGDMNKSFTPYVGGEGLLGVTPAHGMDFAFQASAVAGVMIGGPSFRLDIRLMPQLTYFGNGQYEYMIENPAYPLYGDQYVHYRQNGYGSSFRPNIALRVGAWINHFNFYLQYNHTVSGGITWRL